MTQPLKPHSEGEPSQPSPPSVQPAGSETKLPEIDMGPAKEFLKNAEDRQTDAVVPTNDARPEAASETAKSKHLPTLPGKMRKPLELLEETLALVEREIPELTSSLLTIEILSGNYCSAETPQDLQKKSEHIVRVEKECFKVIDHVLKMCDALKHTCEKGNDLARYTPKAASLPEDSNRKVTIRENLPHGKINAAMGAGSFAVGMGAGIAALGPWLYGACEPLFALCEPLSTMVNVPLIDAGWLAKAVIFMALVNIPTAIFSIVTAGAGTYTYGGLTLAFDKLCVSEEEAVRVWREKMNEAFALAKERALQGLSTVQDCLRRIKDARGKLPALCTEARKKCADRAKEHQNIERWEQEDAEFEAQSTKTEAGAQEEIILELLDALETVTDEVQPIDPLSARDLSWRGFQGLGSICSWLEKLGKAHFFFSKGRPDKDHPKMRTFYNLLGFLGGPLARVGAFLHALTKDGKKPIRMLHMLLGTVLEALRLKGKDAIGPVDLAKAAFDPKTIEKHGLIHCVAAGITDGTMAYTWKMLPLLERASAQRKLSTNKAREKVFDKMSDAQWRQKALHVTGKKVKGIFSDLYSVGKGMADGARRFFMYPYLRLLEDESRAKKEIAPVEQALAEEFPDMRQYASLGNEELRDLIQVEIRAMPPENDQEATRMLTLIDYWEKRLELEDLQGQKLQAGHMAELHDINPLLPSALELMSSSFLKGVSRTLSMQDNMESMLQKINADLVSDARMYRRSVSESAGKDTILASSPDGSLLVLRRKNASPEASGEGAVSNSLEPPTVCVIPAAEAKSFIKRHTSERDSMPAVLFSDERSFLFLAEQAVGGGPLTPAQRKALLELQLNGDPVKGGEELKSLFLESQFEGFRGPHGKHVVPGLKNLFPMVRKRRKLAQES